MPQYQSTSFIGLNGKSIDGPIKIADADDVDLPDKTHDSSFWSGGEATAKAEGADVYVETIQVDPVVVSTVDQATQILDISQAVLFGAIAASAVLLSFMVYRSAKKTSSTKIVRTIFNEATRTTGRLVTVLGTGRRGVTHTERQRRTERDRFLQSVEADYNLALIANTLIALCQIMQPKRLTVDNLNVQQIQSLQEIGRNLYEKAGRPEVRELDARDYQIAAMNGEDVESQVHLLILIDPIYQYLNIVQAISKELVTIEIIKEEINNLAKANWETSDQPKKKFLTFWNAARKEIHGDGPFEDGYPVYVLDQDTQEYVLKTIS